MPTKKTDNSYRNILKGISVFGGVKVFEIVINLIRGKFVAMFLGPDGMGINSIFTSSANTLSQFSSLGLNLAIVKEVAEVKEKDRFHEILGVVLRLTAITAKGFYISSVEIAFRLDSIKKSGILFNENFGVGTPVYTCGEEDLWLHDLLQSGIKGRFFPIIIAMHNGPTTGIRRMSDPAVLRAQGAVITRHYPSTFPMRILLKAWRASRSAKVSFILCLKPALLGMWDAITKGKKLFQQRYDS